MRSGVGPAPRCFFVVAAAEASPPKAYLKATRVSGSTLSGTQVRTLRDEGELPKMFYCVVPSLRQLCS